MPSVVRVLTWLSCVATLGAFTARASANPITLIGTGTVPGNAKDGLTLEPPLLEDGLTPHDQIGGFGSAITYTGVGNLYLATPDRGPADGATTYQDRVYLFSIAVEPGAELPVTVNLEEASILQTRDDKPLTGSAAAFDTGLRLDPEGIRLDGRGGFFVSDEYGPYVYRFSAEGVRTQSLKVPARFAIASPGLNTDESPELPPANVRGRQANRGMEGLAISPSGRKLFGSMQNALIQDGALDADNARVGLNNRILEIDTRTNQTRELVYQVDNKKVGVNEILAINDHEFLTIERDSGKGAEAAFKKIERIDITNATDVSGIDALPTEGLPEGVVAVAKSDFIDLLAPEFGLAGEGFPEKIEGLAFGPRLADGRLLLLVTIDNDFVTENASLVWAFAIEPSVLEYEPQTYTLNIESQSRRGTTTVNVYGQALMPVRELDLASLMLGEAKVSQSETRDLDGDGLDDLALQFESASIGATGAQLIGATTTGTPIRGARRVRVGGYGQR